MKTQKEIVIDLLNSKRFRKNRLYSTKQISSILGTTNNRVLNNGNLSIALKNSPEWKHEYRRMWTYVGPQKPKLFNQPQVQRKPQVQPNPKRREISLFWGLISIK